MKKILHFCDNCKNLVATQRVGLHYKEEKHLTPVGHHEWCNGCIEKLYASGTDIMKFPDVNDSEYEHGGGGQNDERVKHTLKQ